MSLQEKKTEQEIIIQHSEIGGRLFRNNTGTGWQGTAVQERDGVMMIHNPRPLRAGLVTGSSDTIGWTPVIITQDMVGKTLPVFTGFEVKAKGGRLSSEQKIFIGELTKANAIVGVVYSKEDHLKEIEAWKKKMSSF